MITNETTIPYQEVESSDATAFVSHGRVAYGIPRVQVPTRCSNLIAVLKSRPIRKDSVVLNKVKQPPNVIYIYNLG